MLLQNRSYNQRTNRLLAQYLAARFARFPFFLEFHLTAPNPGAIANAGGRVSPRYGGTILGYADGAVILPDEIELWEAKNNEIGVALGQVERYIDLYRESAEAQIYAPRRATGHILVAFDRPADRRRAESRGIEVVIWRPQWYEQDLARRDAGSEDRTAAAIERVGRGAT